MDKSAAEIESRKAFLENVFGDGDSEAPLLEQAPLKNSKIGIASFVLAWCWVGALIAWILISAGPGPAKESALGYLASSLLVLAIGLLFVSLALSIVTFFQKGVKKDLAIASFTLGMLVIVSVLAFRSLTGECIRPLFSTSANALAGNEDALDGNESPRVPVRAKLEPLR